MADARTVAPRNAFLTAIRFDVMTSIRMGVSSCSSFVTVAGPTFGKFVVSRGSMSLGESKGGLPPDDCVEDERVILEDSQRVIERFGRLNATGVEYEL